MKFFFFSFFFLLLSIHMSAIIFFSLTFLIMYSNTAGVDDAQHHYIDLRIMVLFVFRFGERDLLFLSWLIFSLATVIQRNLNGFDYNAKILYFLVSWVRFENRCTILIFVNNITTWHIFWLLLLNAFIFHIHNSYVNGQTFVFMMCIIYFHYAWLGQFHRHCFYFQFKNIRIYRHFFLLHSHSLVRQENLFFFSLERRRKEEMEYI